MADPLLWPPYFSSTYTHSTLVGMTCLGPVVGPAVSAVTTHPLTGLGCSEVDRLYRLDVILGQSPMGSILLGGIRGATPVDPSAEGTTSLRYAAQRGGRCGQGVSRGHSRP